MNGVSQSRILRKLFLTIFLRGRGARGLDKKGAPRSVGSKLALTLCFYALFGLFAAAFVRQGLYALSVYLHASTLMFVGMFVASSAGEALFNKEEADILLHRPVTPRILLWAKVRVIVEIAIWLAVSFNLVGFVVGSFLAENAGLFIFAHTVSLLMDALFCTGVVVVTYQLCLRWFGRERLDSLITTAQTLMAVVVVLGSQLAPQFLMRYEGGLGKAMNAWWIALLPPAWFAGFDDAIAGSSALNSWVFGGIAVAATGILLWAGFGTLARDYGTGLQQLNEAAPARRTARAQRRFFDRLTKLGPIRWWLKDSVTRASFLLTAAYLVRDRDTKLRVYPGLVPMLIMPVIMLMPQRNQDGPGGAFIVGFAGSYLGMVPLMALGFVKYSAHWQAGDIFRAAPMMGPGALCQGARKAVMLLLMLPVLVIFVALVFVLGSGVESLLLLLPGMIVLPVFSMIPCIQGEAVPFSNPPDEAKSAGRGLTMVGVMLVAMLIAGGAALAKHFGFFWHFVVAELVVSLAIYEILKHRTLRLPWPSME